MKKTKSFLADDNVFLYLLYEIVFREGREGRQYSGTAVVKHTGHLIKRKALGVQLKRKTFRKGGRPGGGSKGGLACLESHLKLGPSVILLLLLPAFLNL